MQSSESEYNQKPSFISSHLNFQDGDNGELNLYLSFKGNQVLEGFFFTESGDCKRLIPHLKNISEKVTGLSEKKLHRLRSTDFFKEESLNEDHYLVLGLWRELLNRYLGCHADNLEKKELIVCRCFGVSEESLFKVIDKQEGHLRVLDVTDELMAGGACTSCCDDIQGLILSYQFRNQIIAGKGAPFGKVNDRGERSRIGGKASSWWLIKIDEVLKKLEYQREAEIMDLSGYRLSFNFSPEVDQEKRITEWEELLELELGVRFTLQAVAV